MSEVIGKWMNLIEAAKDLKLGIMFTFTFLKDNIPEKEAQTRNPWKELKGDVHRSSPSNLTEYKLFIKENRKKRQFLFGQMHYKKIT